MSTCTTCSAPLAADQRYCLQCGTRHGEPRVGLAELDAVLPPAVAAAPSAPPPARGERIPFGPSGVPPVVPAALAVVCGLLIGVTWGPGAPAEGAAQRAYAVRVPAAASAAASTAAVAPPPAPTGDLPEATAPELAATPAPQAEDLSPAPAPTEAADDGAAADAAAAGDGATDDDATSTGDDATTTGTSGDDGTATAGTGDASPIKHVFLIALADQPAALTYAPTSPATYLTSQLVPKGVLLPNHHAVTGGGLPNLMAMVSGQGPTPQAQAGCTTYTDVAPGTLGDDGQVVGDGCVMPPAGGTIADQLRANDRDWGAFVQGMAPAAAAAGGAPACVHPAPGAPSPVQPGANYATQRDPFAYFHSITDDAAGCAARDRDLGQLDAVLAGPADDVPALSFIAPGPCSAGSDVPCAPGAPAGLATADAFLQAVVPKIQASAAYADGGLIVITTDAAPATGPGADRASCCTPPAFPNVPGQAPGGGRVGMLLLSDLLASPGTQVQTPSDHYDLLATLEDTFGLPRLGYAARKTVKGIGLPALLKSTEGSDGSDVATTG